jgi:hypothetical protein
VLTVLILIATPAFATPVTFYFSSGSAQVTATAGATTIVSETIALDGVFVAFDDAVPELVDFSITAPQSAPITMLNPYGGYDTFVIESASIDPGVTFSNISVTSTGLDTWSFLVGPIDVEGLYSASHSSGSPPPVSNVAAPFAGASYLNGSIDTDLMTFELLGVTLTDLPGASFGETDDLIVKADLTSSSSEPNRLVFAVCIYPGLGMARLLKSRNSSQRQRRVSSAWEKQWGAPSRQWGSRVSPRLQSAPSTTLSSWPVSGPRPYSPRIRRSVSDESTSRMSASVAVLELSQLVVSRQFTESSRGYGTASMSRPGRPSSCCLSTPSHNPGRGAR